MGTGHRISKGPLYLLLTDVRVVFQVKEDVQELCREILVTRSPKEQHRVQLDLKEMLHPPRPLTPTPSASSQVSNSSPAASLGE